MILQGIGFNKNIPGIKPNNKKPAFQGLKGNLTKDTVQISFKGGAEKPPIATAVELNLKNPTALGANYLQTLNPYVSSAIAAIKPKKQAVSAETALNKLLEGNDRFVKGLSQNPNNSSSVRSSLTAGQNPIAVVVACSDSRVPPELIFDQGLGDIFVIRNAGNVISPDVLGTAEYAIKHLNPKLVMVLGHEDCGAVKASLEDKAPEGNIACLTNAIKPAVEKAKHQQGDLLNNSIMENIRQSADEIANLSPVIKESMLNDGVKVVGAYYDLHTGKVNLVK